MVSPHAHLRCILFNPVAPYQYLLPTVYLFMADNANPDLFVCGCRTWICLDITRLYEEQRQQSSGSTLPACLKTINRAPITVGGRFRHNFTAACPKHCDYPTTCRLCRLEIQSQIQFSNIILMADKHNIPNGKMHNNCRFLPEDIVCKITQGYNIRRANICDPALKLLNEEITSDIQNTNKT